MQPLIDGDILRYEVGFAAEAGWKNGGIPPWEYVEELLVNRINNICGVVGATAPLIIYLTGKTNFRFKLATRRPYKERNAKKPWHFYNISAYLKGCYDVRIVEGFEADDLMAIEQSRRERAIEEGVDSVLRSIICTRDKDLRAVPGWHYGWELGNQPQFGPELVDKLGYIKLSSDRKSIKGTGLLFFLGQCLYGDPTDTIPGVDGCGPVGTVEALEGATTFDEAYNIVRQMYLDTYGEKGLEYLLESGRLLWMTRDVHPDGSPVLWELPL